VAGDGGYLLTGQRVRCEPVLIADGVAALDLRVVEGVDRDRALPCGYFSTASRRASWISYVARQTEWSYE
jgi:hypothetical protein